MPIRQMRLYWSLECHSVLGPLLFGIYVNEMVEGITSNISAHDSILYRRISGDDDPEAIQSNLQRLIAWSITWQKHFNINKIIMFNYMHITKKRTVKQSQYVISEDGLGIAHHHPCQGVDFSDDLRWNIIYHT